MKRTLVAGALLAILAGCGETIGDIENPFQPAEPETTEDPVTTPEPEPEPEPTASTVEFSGKDFGYPPLVSGALGLILDPREDYTIYAYNYVEAQSLLEAMHTINHFRLQPINIVNGGAETIDSLVEDYCPPSGGMFLSERCGYYARLAYAKTTNQDGWQEEQRINMDVPMTCGNTSVKFVDCHYSILGFNGLMATDVDYDSVTVHLAAPIIGWSFEQNWQKIVGINRAALAFFDCTYEPFNEIYDTELRSKPVISMWTGRYNEFIAWAFVPDVYEDVYRDTTAKHPQIFACQQQFATDLKAIEPRANI